MDDIDFEEWLKALDDPERRNDAARVIFYRYYSQLLTILQRRLADRFLPRFDSEDVLQSAFMSFLGKAHNVTDVECLYPYLKSICLNKLHARIRFHERDRRDVNRDTASDPNAATERGVKKTNGRLRDGGTPSLNSPTSAPTPSSLSELDLGSEEIRHVLRRMAAGFSAEDSARLLEFVEALPEETARMFCHKLTGMTEQQIAEKFGRSRRTVTRKMQVVRALLDHPDD